ncbi:MAG: Flp pilus assembly protein CpaB [Clostridiales bacterium]|nr:Flp pilus assembly protein CpaB [Clostridiales bacterium]
MESVNKKVIIIAVLLSLITSVLIYVYITNATQKQETVEYVNVYVAAKNLEPKQTIMDADVKVMQVEKGTENSRALTSKTEIVGKKLKESILEGEVFVAERLLDEKKLTLAYKIPEGMRAVTINVAENTAVGYLMRPGDNVDIVATFEMETVEQTDTKTIYPRITRMILQNVLVLSMGQDQEIEDETIKEGQKTVTLAVKTDEVEDLVYASQYSLLSLVLRPAEDTSTIDSQGAVRDDISSRKGVMTVPKTAGE